MDVFALLGETAHRQNKEGDLPDFILPLLMKVADNPERFAGREEQVEELVKYVEDYETFSEMCCEKSGYGMEDIRRTLAELHAAV